MKALYVGLLPCMTVVALAQGSKGTVQAELGNSVGQSNSDPKATIHTGPGQNIKSSQVVSSQGKRLQVVDFEDAQIDGKTKAPEGFMIQSRIGDKKRSVVRLRQDFGAQLGAMP